MKREWTIFLTAIMFYTRIPVPGRIDHNQELLDESSRYFPFIGWIVGGVAAGVFYLSDLVFSDAISVIFSMAATIFLTGAFHEDGFADMCDGFGGGWTRKQVLEIMKDSRIGTYGTIGLIMMLLAKFLMLVEIGGMLLPVVLFAGHSVSRFAVSIFRFSSSYVRENEDARAKPMAKSISLKNLLIGAFFGVFPLFYWGAFVAFQLLLPMVVVLFLFVWFCHERIGGYTGDCLGAAQQICELVFYMSILAVWILG